MPYSVAPVLSGLIVGVAFPGIDAHVTPHLVLLVVLLPGLVLDASDRIQFEVPRRSFIATVASGVVLGNYGRRVGMSHKTSDAIDQVWEFIGFPLTAVVFLLVGLAIPLERLGDALPWTGWGIVGVLIGRAVVIYGMLGLGSRFVRRYQTGRPIPASWLHVLFWAGLRGAVAVAIAHSLPDDVEFARLPDEVDRAALDAHLPSGRVVAAVDLVLDLPPAGRGLARRCQADASVGVRQRHVDGDQAVVEEAASRRRSLDAGHVGAGRAIVRRPREGGVVLGVAVG